ncbi:MAG: methyltransferase domain-containing protein, partial [Paracoccaceae bacterium]
MRPALDLLRALPPLPEGPVVDLGCGNGAAGPALATLGRTVTGIDASPAMLGEARETGVYASLHQMDIAAWTSEAPAPALIFCNAVLHWLP